MARRTVCSACPPCHSVAALARQIENSAPRAEQPYFHGIRIQTQNICNLLHRKPFDLFQDQHEAVAFLKSFQQPFDALPVLELFADVRHGASSLTRYRVLPRLVFAQVRLINQRAHLLFSQQIPTFVHRYLIEPSAECGPLIETLQREISLYEDLLGNIFHVLPPAKNSAGNRKNPMLMAPDKLLKGGLVLCLSAPDQFAVIGRSGCIRGTSRRYRRGGYLWGH